MQGLIGRKIGMTQVYDKDGRRVAVTVLEAGPCVVTALKTPERDGYAAAQLGFGEIKEGRLTKPVAGAMKKAGVPARRHLLEFELDAGETPNLGDTVSAAAVFAEAVWVDVSGLTKGRGFQGVVKRHGFAGGPHGHGGHSKRRPGSIGMKEHPGKVAKNMRMAGHLGHARVSIRNLRVVEVRADENLLVVEGAVPGPNGALLEIRKALKTKKAGKA